MVADMTRITYGGLVYVQITKEDWEFDGGQGNPDLLKLRNKTRERVSYRYFRLREHGQPEAAAVAPVESATEAALRRWREEGVLP